MGQTVLNADLDEVPEPTFDNRIRNADYPEWQCQIPSKLYGGFYGMPWHCQWAEIKRRSFEGGEQSWTERWKEQNPINVRARRGSTAPPANTNSDKLPASFNRLINYSLSSTTRRTDDGKVIKRHDKIAVVEIEPPDEPLIDMSDTGVLSAQEEYPIADIWFIKGKEEAVGQQIKDFLDRIANSEKCAKAFQAIGATPISQQTVIIVTESVFTKPNWDSRWTLGSGVGEAMRKQLIRTTTTFDISYGNFEKLGGSFIGITNAALNGEEDLEVIIIHSLIHTGGINGVESEEETYGFQAIRPHDLKYKGQLYKDVLKACTKREGSKLLYGQ